MNHNSAYLIVICESFNMKNPSKQMHNPRHSNWARSADEQPYMTNTGLARRITMSCPSLLGCAFQMGCVHPLVRDRSSSKPQPGSMPYKLGVRPAPNNRGTRNHLKASQPQHSMQHPSTYPTDSASYSGNVHSLARNQQKSGTSAVQTWNKRHQRDV